MRDPDLRKQIRAAAWDQAQVTDASLLLVLCADLKAWEKDPARYWRDAPEAGEALSFGRVWRLGTIEAMAWAVRSGRAVAVLPQYLMARDLKRGVVRTILPSVTPLRDAFRLVFRADDPRRPTFLRMAEAMRGVPLR